MNGLIKKGKSCDPVDIIVTRTYRNENQEKGVTMFYLRDNLAALKKILATLGNRFRDIDDYAIIQMFSMCLRKDETGDRKSFGITKSSGQFDNRQPRTIGSAAKKPYLKQ